MPNLYRVTMNGGWHAETNDTSRVTINGWRQQENSSRSYPAPAAIPGGGFSKTIVILRRGLRR